jgi:hypothetical protein
MRIQKSYYDEDKLARKQLKNKRSSSYDKNDIILRDNFYDEDSNFEKNLEFLKNDK